MDGGKYGRILGGVSIEKYADWFEQFKPMASDKFAVLALNKIAKNKAVIIIPGWMSLILWMDRLFPSLSHLANMKIQRDFIASLGLK